MIQRTETIRIKALKRQCLEQEISRDDEPIWFHRFLNDEQNFTGQLEGNARSNLPPPPWRGIERISQRQLTQMAASETHRILCAAAPLATPCRRLSCRRRLRGERKRPASARWHGLCR